MIHCCSFGWDRLTKGCDGMHHLFVMAFFVANATQNLRCIYVAIIVIINATQMNRKEKEAEFCGTGKQYVGI